MNKFLLSTFLVGSLTILLGTDLDNDLIDDKYDKCPSTPQGVCVDQYGCTKKIKMVINFDSGSYKLNEETTDKFTSIAKIAQECFGYNIVISGNTDSTSTEQLNNQLSKQRANTIKELMLLFGIDNSRLTTKWYGETKPVAPNITPDGRYKNRRVEILFK